MRRRALLAASQMTGGGTPDIPNTDEWDYYTVIPEEDCEVGITPFCGSNDILFGDMEYECLPFSYRINGGNWIDVSLGTTREYYITISVKANDKIQVKSYGNDFNSGDYISDAVTLRVVPRCKFKVCGTPMSIIYGDDFKNNNFVPPHIILNLLQDSMVTEILNPDTFLPYTEVGEYAYSTLFAYCTELTNAPVLPAAILTQCCYSYMFNECPKINYIKMLATDISAEDCLYNWVSGVSPTGTFVKHPEATWDVRGVNGVPEGWTIKFDGEEEGDNRPPESTKFEFPLYLNTELTEDGYRYREADDIHNQLYSWIDENIQGVGIHFGDIPADVINSNPIFIDGHKVSGIHKEFGAVDVYFEDNYGYEGYMGCSIESYAIFIDFY